MSAIPDDQAAYVETVAQFLSDAGLPRMAGRIWAWLLICDPPQQTAADLAEALHASRGSISGMVRLLATAGLIHRSTRRGDRREYFSIPPGSVVEILGSRLPTATTGRRLAERGLALLEDRPAPTRERLEELRDAYAFIEREWPALMRQFIEERAGGPVAVEAPEATAMERTA